MSNKLVKLVLPCVLTDAEYQEAAKKLTDLLCKKATLEAEKSSAARHYKDAIDYENSKIGDQTPIVATGVEEREVECVMIFNEPERGLVRTIRLDTNEQVSVREMNESEKADLFYNAETTPQPALPCSDPAPAETPEVTDAEVVEPIPDAEVVETATEEVENA